ncbi:hypothetical protein [Nonomuraea pusilla]|nr:hypothetical protein [Nonomuraea pusilla]
MEAHMHGGGEFAELISAVRSYRREGGDAVGGAQGEGRPRGRVVAEAYGDDVRPAARVLLVASALCDVTGSRLVARGDARWRRLAAAFGAADAPDLPDVALVTAGPHGTGGDRGGDTGRDPGAEADADADVPVVRVEGGGTLKAYACFPGEDLTERVGAFFEHRVWPSREAFGADAEREARLARGDHGVNTETERRQLRSCGLRRLGLDEGRPTVTVWGHAPGTPMYEATAEFAAGDETANWLFPDRPGSRVPSDAVLWSMTDLGVAFGDSDLPAFGLPVVQAGPAEWSGCGVTHVTRSPAEHLDVLRDAIARHAKGESVLGPEQRERGRLRLWLRRRGADVPTPLLPHWELGGDHIAALAAALRGATAGEPGDDTLHEAVRRLWSRRDPLLTRFDFQDPEGPARSTR